LTAASTRDDRQVQSPTVTRAPPTLAVVDFAGSSGQAGGPSGGHGGNGRLGLAANGTAGSGAGRGGAGRVNGVPTALVSNPLPPYPPDLLASGVEGVVLLRVSILADGRVAEAKLETSSGHASLDESALTTVRDQWRFAPAQRNGIDVPCEVLLPIRFRVRDGN
jgi:TonB family protein